MAPLVRDVKAQPFVAFSSEPARKSDRVLAPFVYPFGTGSRRIAAEDVGGARALSAMDRQRWSDRVVKTRIELADRLAFHLVILRDRCPQARILSD